MKAGTRWGRLQENQVQDSLGRALTDLRVSVTDRCNFRCAYCMPRSQFGSGYPFSPHSHILSFEEITRICGVMVELGVRKIRLTGGEPLLRRDLPVLVEQLATLPALELTLTTNGTLLPLWASSLRAAGLQRLTISLDALDQFTFQSMSATSLGVDLVLKGIESAFRAGFEAIKINTVIQRGVNEHAILALARHFRGQNVVLRFIEYMDVGNHNSWTPDQVVSAAQIHALINAVWPLELIPNQPAHPVARRYRYLDGQGEIGLIAAVSHPFCAGCSRLRLSADGSLFTCLFASSGHDLKTAIRSGCSNGELRARIQTLWSQRADRYSEQRQAGTKLLNRVEMSYIGG